jgi:hypothetical protein
MKLRPNPALERQRRAERQQRGTKSGADYRAYIQVRRGDFASRGRSHYVLSALIDRHHDVLSDLELHTLWHLQRLNPVDVREGMPLLFEGVEPEFEWSEHVLGTLAISAVLGFPHPTHNSEEPRRMTTDFLVTLHGGTRVAIHVKYEKDLDDRRNKELRAIEESYWLRRRVRFHVITEADLNRTAIGNLGMFASFDKADVNDITDEWLAWIAIAARSLPMSTVLRAVSSHQGVPYVALVNRVKYAAMCGLLLFDLTQGVLDWNTVWPPMRLGCFGALRDDSEVVSHD